MVALAEVVFLAQIKLHISIIWCTLRTAKFSNYLVYNYVCTCVCAYVHKKQAILYFGRIDILETAAGFYRLFSVSYNFIVI